MILYFLNLVYVLSLVGLCKNCFYLTLYDAICKKGGKQIWVSVSFISFFFLELYTCEQQQTNNIIIKKKGFVFKHENNNQTVSNDWPTCCHTGIYFGLVIRIFNQDNRRNCYFYIVLYAQTVVPGPLSSCIIY